MAVAPRDRVALAKVVVSEVISGSRGNESRRE